MYIEKKWMFRIDFGRVLSNIILSPESVSCFVTSVTSHKHYLWVHS